MTSEGLEKMFEGDFAEVGAENFRWSRWGAEQMVWPAQTRERGPPSAPAEILYVVIAVKRETNTNPCFSPGRIMNLFQIHICRKRGSFSLFKLG